jgi:hypothetical protein
MIELRTQSNEKRCSFIEHEHVLNLPECCPISHNPRPGSTIALSYKGKDTFLEVYSLRKFVDSYRGGKDGVRSMEGMLQEITQACATVLGVEVRMEAMLVLEPQQKMRVICYAFPWDNENEDLSDLEKIVSGSGPGIAPDAS